MILLIHITIALASLAYTTYLFLSPSKAKLNISYALIAATLTTGTYLVVSTHSPLLKSCVTGLVYLGVVSAATIAARHKLAHLV